MISRLPTEVVGCVATVAASGRFLGAGLIALTLCLSVSSVPAARAADVTSTWLGGTGDWSDPSGWDSADFPDNGNGGYTYDAVIGVGTVTVDQDVTIEGLTLSGGSLTSAAEFTLMINESMSWTAGTMTGAGTTVIGPDATLSLSSGSTPLHLRQMLVNEGTTTFTGGNLALQNATFRNDELFAVSGGTSFSSNSAGSVNTFENNGTLVKQGAGSASYSFDTLKGGVTFNNTGTVDVQEGTLDLQNGGTHTGSFIGSADATLRFAGNHTFAAGANMTGAMNIEFSSGLMTVDSEIATGASLTFTGAGNKTFNGPVSAGALHLSGSGTVFFNDSLSVPGGTISGGSLAGPADWTVSDTLTWSGGMMTGAGTTTIAANATLSLGGSTVLHLRRRLVNEGTTTWRGSLALQDNATFQNDGLFIAAGGGSFNGNSSSSSTNTFQNNGTFVKQVDTLTSFNAYNSGVTFNNAGTVDIQAGLLELHNGGTHTGSFAGLAKSTLRLGGSHTFAIGADITGGLNIEFGTSDMTIDSAVDTTGKLTFVGYYSAPAATRTFNGPVSAGSLHLMAYSGSAVFNDTLSTPGGNIEGGTLTGSADWTVTDTLTWDDDGTMAGTGTTTIAPGAILSLDRGLNGERHLGRLLVNKGTTTWTRGHVVLQDHTTFQNDGLFIANTWYSFSGDDWGGTNKFQNSGMFLKQGTTTTTFSSSGGGVTFNNAGTVDVQAGTLILQYGGTHTGSFTGSAGAALQFSGNHTFATGADVTGGMDIVFGSGVMTIESEVATTGGLTIGGSKTFNRPVSAGTIHLGGGEVVFNDSLSAPVGSMTGGTISGAGDWTVTDMLTWSGGTMEGAGATVIGPDATLALGGSGGRYLRRLLVNQGHTTWTGGGVLMKNGTFQNEGLFTANLSSLSSFGAQSNSPGSVNTLQNNGTFIKQGTGTARFGSISGTVTFNNTGTVDVQQGTLELVNGGTHTGGFTGSAGAMLRFEDDHTFATGADITGGMNVHFGLGVMALESEIATPGSVTLYGEGKKTLNGPVSAGSLTVSSFATAVFNGPVSAGSLDISSTGTATFNDSILAPGGSLSYGTLSGSADWTVTDTLTWTYGGTMTGTGTTTITKGANLVLSGIGFNTGHLRRLLVNEGTIQWTGGYEFGGSYLTMRNGAIQNNGLFVANSSLPLIINSDFSSSVSTFDNNGAFITQGAGTVTFSANNGGVTFENTGTVDVQQGTLSLQGAITQLSGSTLTGGTWIVRDGAVLAISGDRNVLVNEANVELHGPNASFAAMNSISENAGRFSIVGGHEFITVGDFHNLGELNIGAESSLVVNGDYRQDADASLTVSIGGEAVGESHDPMSIAGTATLSGLLRVLPTDLGGELFRPQIGETFVLLSAANGLEGTTFDAIDLPTRFGGLDYQWTTTYGANEVILELEATFLSGDFNRDGTVDAADYVVWRNGLGSDFTIDDYTTWKEFYGATVPGGVAIANQNAGNAIPEPGTLRLAALVVVLHLAAACKARDLKSERHE